MAAYLVATVTITDPVKFADYVSAIAGISEKHGGEYVCRGPVVETLEGDVLAGERVIVSCFPTASAARGYVASAEYRAAAKLREGAGTVQMRLLVE